MSRQVYLIIIAVIAVSIPAIHFIHLYCDPALQAYSLDCDGVQGIPLERYLWRQGTYPVTGIYAGGGYVNWTDAAYRSLWYIPALVRPDGSLSIFGTPLEGRDIAVATVPRPERSILEVAPSACGALGLDGTCGTNSSQVVVVYVDALGWQRYEWARPAMRNLSALEPSMAHDVYPSISNVNAAAMLTGVPPERSGVDRWENRTMLVDNCIEKALRNGVSAAWVDGPRPPVSLSRGIIRETDRNGDGRTDDEIMGRAIAEYENGTRLLYVHLYETDRALHDTGPYSQRSLDALARADQLIGALLGRIRPGTLLIVTSDHGGHEIEDGRGDHGTLLPQDMLVPLAVRAC